MIMIDLFSGTKSMSNAFKKAGWQTLSIDNDANTCPDLGSDIHLLTAKEGKALTYKIPTPFDHPDVLWASPPCTCFSVASMGHHWKQPYGTPRTQEAIDSIQLVLATQRLICELKPKYWFIENPRGMLRKLAIMQGMKRHTITYCQYGDNRMKPTDIWTNHPNPCFKPPCKNGMTCHQSAPRGSKTGTQGLKNARERGRIPQAFCEHIQRICQTDDIHNTMTPR